MKSLTSLRRVAIVSGLSIIAALTLEAAPLTFSGMVTGTAAEDFQGRCTPLITVNATGSGSSNLLGTFVDAQSHCDASFTTFNNGLFTLTSQTMPADSISGSYSGSALLGTNGTLTFSADLTVTGGSGQFTKVGGNLSSTGSLDSSGAFRASFSGQVETVPEPCTLLLLSPGSAVLCFARRKSLADLHPEIFISK